MKKISGIRRAVIAAAVAMLLVLVVGCTETVEVPGETVVVEKVVVKEVMVPGETVVVEKEVVKEVMVPGETVVVEKEVVKTVEVPVEKLVVERVRSSRTSGGRRALPNPIPSMAASSGCPRPTEWRTSTSIKGLRLMPDRRTSTITLSITIRRMV